MAPSFPCKQKLGEDWFRTMGMKPSFLLPCLTQPPPISFPLQPYLSHPLMWKSRMQSSVAVQDPSASRQDCATLP